jgi:hypothetical protein
MGLGIASVSYDSAALLRNFAERKDLHYPMLSDPESKMIRAFDILNDNFPKDNQFYGVPFPGMYIIDERGIVKAKYFEDDHRERYTAASILVHQFGQDGVVKTAVDATHIQLTYSASDAALSPGGTATLILDIDLKPGMHVYAPGVEGGYIPIDWKMPESKGWIAGPASYPESRKLNLAAIHEIVPVYEGRVRILRDITIGQPPELAPILTPDRSVSIEGSFRYQACDEKECYPPQSIPLKWTFRVDKLDPQRAPIQMQRGASRK